MNLLYDLINHIKRLKEIAVSASSQRCLWYNHSVDYRVGIFPFNVNKCDVTETLLLHGAA